MSAILLIGLQSNRIFGLNFIRLVPTNFLHKRMIKFRSFFSSFISGEEG